MNKQIYYFGEYIEDYNVTGDLQSDQTKAIRSYLNKNNSTPSSSPMSIKKIYTSEGYAIRPNDYIEWNTHFFWGLDIVLNQDKLQNINLNEENYLKFGIEYQKKIGEEIVVQNGKTINMPKLQNVHGNDIYEPGGKDRYFSLKLYNSDRGSSGGIYKYTPTNAQNKNLFTCIAAIPYTKYTDQQTSLNENPFDAERLELASWDPKTKTYIDDRYFTIHITLYNSKKEQVCSIADTYKVPLKKLNYKDIMKSELRFNEGCRFEVVNPLINSLDWVWKKTLFTNQKTFVANITGDPRNMDFELLCYSKHRYSDNKNHYFELDSLPLKYTLSTDEDIKYPSVIFRGIQQAKTVTQNVTDHGIRSIDHFGYYGSVYYPDPVKHFGDFYYADLLIPYCKNYPLVNFTIDYDKDKSYDATFERGCAIWYKNDSDDNIAKRQFKLWEEGKSNISIKKILESSPFKLIDFESGSEDPAEYNQFKFQQNPEKIWARIAPCDNTVQPIWSYVWGITDELLGAKKYEFLPREYKEITVQNSTKTSIRSSQYIDFTKYIEQGHQVTDYTGQELTRVYLDNVFKASFYRDIQHEEKLTIIYIDGTPKYPNDFILNNDGDAVKLGGLEQINPYIIYTDDKSEILDSVGPIPYYTSINEDSGPSLHKCRFDELYFVDLKIPENCTHLSIDLVSLSWGPMKANYAPVVFYDTNKKYIGRITADELAYENNLHKTYNFYTGIEEWGFPDLDYINFLVPLKNYKIPQNAKYIKLQFANTGILKTPNDYLLKNYTYRNMFYGVRWDNGYTKPDVDEFDGSPLLLAKNNMTMFQTTKTLNLYYPLTPDMSEISRAVEIPINWLKENEETHKYELIKRQFYSHKTTINHSSTIYDENSLNNKFINGSIIAKYDPSMDKYADEYQGGKHFWDKTLHPLSLNKDNRIELLDDGKGGKRWYLTIYSTYPNFKERLLIKEFRYNKEFDNNWAMVPFWYMILQDIIGVRPNSTFEGINQTIDVNDSQKSENSNISIEFMSDYSTSPSSKRGVQCPILNYGGEKYNRFAIVLEEPLETKEVIHMNRNGKGVGDYIPLTFINDNGKEKRFKYHYRSNPIPVNLNKWTVENLENEFRINKSIYDYLYKDITLRIDFRSIDSTYSPINIQIPITSINSKFSSGQKERKESIYTSGEKEPKYCVCVANSPYYDYDGSINYEYSRTYWSKMLYFDNGKDSEGNVRQKTYKQYSYMDYDTPHTIQK